MQSLGRQTITRLPLSSVTAIRGTTLIHSFALAIQFCCANALDSGATTIDVSYDLQELSAAITDNGNGIPAEDFHLLGQLHCTSKARAGRALGRNGCFLSSLSEVATVEIISKANGAFRTMRKTLKAGNISDFGLASSPQHGQGTKVTFKDFLSRQPVRRKLLTAFRRQKEVQVLCKQLLGLFALYPSVGLVVRDRHGDGALLELPEGRLEADVLQQIFGSPAAAVKLQACADAKRVAITGHIAPPWQRSNKLSGPQILLVNGHPVVCTQVTKLIATLQAQVLQGGRKRRGAAHDVANSSHLLPAMLVQIIVPQDTVQVSLENEHCTATFLQWPLVCKALIRGLAEAWQEDLTEGMLRSVVLNQPGTAEARAVNEKAASKSTAIQRPSDMASRSNEQYAISAKRRRAALVSRHSSDVATVMIPTMHCEEASLKASLSNFPLSDRRQSGPSSGPVPLSSEPRTMGVASAPSITWPRGGLRRPVNPSCLRESLRRETETSSLRSSDATFARHRSAPAAAKLASDCELHQTQVQVADPKHGEHATGAGRLRHERSNKQHIRSAVASLQWTSDPDLAAANALQNSFLRADARHERQMEQFRSRSSNSSAHSTLRPDTTATPLPLPVDSRPRHTRTAPASAMPVVSSNSPPLRVPSSLAAPLNLRGTLGMSSGCKVSNVDQLQSAAAISRTSSAPPHAVCMMSSCHRNPSTADGLKTLHGFTCDVAQRVIVSATSTGRLLANQTEALVPNNRSHDAKQLMRFDGAASPKKVSDSAGPPFPKSIGLQPVIYTSKESVCQLGVFSSETTEELAHDTETEIIALLAAESLPSPELETKYLDAHGRQQELQHVSSRPEVAKSQHTSQTKLSVARTAALSGVRRRRRVTGGSHQLDNNSRETFQFEAPKVYRQMHTSRTRSQGPPADKWLKQSDPHAKATDSPQPAAFGPPQSPAPSFKGPNTQANAAFTSLRPPLRALLDEWSNPAIKGAGQRAETLSVDNLMAPTNGAIMPDAVCRDDLQNATVVGQMDAKFVVLRVERLSSGGSSTVSHGCLAIMDQHAADERIRLEALQKSLLLPNGEPRNIQTCRLSPQHRLLLTDAENELLKRYSEDVARWGWIVTSGPAGLFVIRAPNLDGIVLTATDLKMYLHLLDSTGGSARQPPRVAAVLNSRACRSAIMFGDILSERQCTQLLHELRETRLFNVCAHGRPTITPLVDLDVLTRHCPKAIPSPGVPSATPMPNHCVNP